MSVLNESGLRDALKTNPADVYLIYGEENYLKKVYVERIVEKTVDKAFADFNYRVFDGENASLADVYESVVAAPFGSETKCVVAKDFPLDALDDDDFESLKVLLSYVPDGCALVFYFTLYEPKGAKWNKVKKLFEERGKAVRLDKKSPYELVGTLENGAKRRNAVFGKGVASHMISRVGNDLGVLLNETEKVCAYAAGGEIKKSDVDAVCVKNLDARVFDMIRDLLSGALEGALKKLSELLERGEEELQILGALSAQYSDIYRVKAAAEAGLKSKTIAEYYNYSGKEFRLTNAARNASALTPEETRERIEILLRADVALKSSPEDKKTLLERTIIELAGADGFSSEAKKDGKRGSKRSG